MHLHINKSNSADNNSAIKTLKKKLTFIFVLTFIFFIIEIIGGILSNSLALVADSFHMLQDVGALALAMFAVFIVQKPKNKDHSFGFKRAEVVTAFVNGLSLLILGLFIIIESINRLNNPLSIESELMFGIAFLGLIVNLIALFLLHSDSKHSMNTKGAYLHIIGDTLGSLGALVASILITITGLMIFDIIISILISLIILSGSVRLIRESLHILMEGKPDNLNIEDIESKLMSLKGIKNIHDIHAWMITSNQNNFSCHIEITKDAEPCKILKSVNDILAESFNIHHSTIQVEHENQFVNCGDC